VHQVGCDKNDEDKQGKCMEKCDDAYIKATQAYVIGKDSTQVKKESEENRKVCEKACGC
jgi:hypothetical protein